MLRVYFPSHFRIVVVMHGSEHEIHEFADVNCNLDVCAYEFTEQVLQQLQNSKCYVIVMKNTKPHVYTCKEFTEFIALAGGEVADKEVLVQALQ
jgi:hypothetical protein